MKKSQLRKIIKESIKELNLKPIKEQSGNITPCSQTPYPWICNYIVNPGPNGWSTGAINPGLNTGGLGGGPSNHPNVRSVYFSCCNESNTTPSQGPSGMNWYGAVGFSGVGQIGSYTQCMTINGQVPVVGDFFQAGNHEFQGISAPLATGGNVCRVFDVWGEQCTMNGYDGTEYSGGMSQPYDYDAYTGGGSSLGSVNYRAAGCPGTTIAPIVGCMDTNNSDCDPNATMNDQSMCTGYDIAEFNNGFGCHDPVASNYQAPSYMQGQLSLGCNVYPSVTSTCGVSMPDMQAVIAAFQMNSPNDTSCCNYGYSCAATFGASQQFACSPGNATNPGQYPTLAACQASNPNMPSSCGGAPNPSPKKAPDDEFGTLVDPTDLVKTEPTEPTDITGDEEDEEVKRMKELAFRNK